MTYDYIANNLLKLASEQKTGRFWIEDGVLIMVSQRVFVLRWGNLWKDILKECHDSLWAGHPGMTCALVLINQYYYWH